MQLDALTAGISLVLVQLCIALVMAGIFYALPNERCTRYWALSGLSVALGLLLVVLNAGALQPAVLMLGNGLVILGFVFQWAGIRLFYRKPRGYAGWAVALAFMLVFGVLVAQKAPVGERVLAASVSLLLMSVLCLYELLAGRAQRKSYAGLLAIGAISLLSIAYGLRAKTALSASAALTPQSDNLATIALLYFVPLVGSLLFSCGLLLLYFEQIIQDKHHLATHDELTGLLNRRAIVAAGERELSVAKRMRTPLAVGLVDIDHFKQINDTRGHDIGDKVLVELARVLQKTCRSIDLVGRYGGEEFCFVFPGVDHAAGQLLAERIISTVREHDFDSGLKVTASIGMAIVSPHQIKNSWPAVVRRADKALYQAKQEGRDRWVMARDG